MPPDVPVIEVRPPGRWINLNLKELWTYRELLYFFVWRDIKVRYKQTVIGAGWAIIQPLMTMIVFSLIFGKLAKLSPPEVPAPLFFYAALVPWMYFANALHGATNSVVENERMVTKVYFPRMFMPLGAVLSGLLDLGISFVLLVGIMVYYGVAVTPDLLWLPVFLVLTVGVAFGAGLWSSALNAVYRDVRYAIPFLIQFWMFASPVAYPSSLVPEQWRWLYGLNPMAGAIEGFRWALTGIGGPSTVMLAVSAATVLVLIGGGIAFFRKMEGIIADVL